MIVIRTACQKKRDRDFGKVMKIFWLFAFSVHYTPHTPHLMIYSLNNFEPCKMYHINSISRNWNCLYTLIIFFFLEVKLIHKHRLYAPSSWNMFHNFTRRKMVWLRLFCLKTWFSNFVQQSQLFYIACQQQQQHTTMIKSRIKIAKKEKEKK